MSKLICETCVHARCSIDDNIYCGLPKSKGCNYEEDVMDEARDDQ